MPASGRLDPAPSPRGRGTANAIERHEGGSSGPRRSLLVAYRHCHRPNVSPLRVPDATWAMTAL
jgi:hypothetical protein